MQGYGACAEEWKHDMHQEYRTVNTTNCSMNERWGMSRARQPACLCRAKVDFVLQGPRLRQKYARKEYIWYYAKEPNEPSDECTLPTFITSPAKLFLHNNDDFLLLLVKKLCRMNPTEWDQRQMCWLIRQFCFIQRKCFAVNLYFPWSFIYVYFCTKSMLERWVCQWWWSGFALRVGDYAKLCVWQLWKMQWNNPLFQTTK